MLRTLVLNINQCMTVCFDLCNCISHCISNFVSATLYHTCSEVCYGLMKFTSNTKVLRIISNAKHFNTRLKALGIVSNWFCKYRPLLTAIFSCRPFSSKSYLWAFQKLSVKRSPVSPHSSISQQSWLRLLISHSYTYWIWLWVWTI